MRLTLQTDYGMRLLILLALEPGRLVTIEEASERFGISRNHLMKVASALAHAGLVIASRGRGGGLELARDPATLRLGDVVRALEPDMALAECLRADGGACRITGPCRLTGILGEATSAFLRALDSHVLAELAGPAAALRRALGLGAGP